METIALNFGFPKKGRQEKEFNELLKIAGITLDRENDRLSYGILSDQTGELPAIKGNPQRGEDSLKKMAAGIYDAAVVAWDEYYEVQAEAKKEGYSFNIKRTVEFNSCSSCDLSFAGSPVTTPADLAGKTIGVSKSYRNTLENYLDNNGIKDAKIVAYGGTIESCITDGEAEVIFDVVQSGKTLRAHKIQESLKMFGSNLIFVERGDLDENKKALCREFRERLLMAEQVFIAEKKEKDKPPMSAVGKRSPVLAVAA